MGQTKRNLGSAFRHPSDSTRQRLAESKILKIVEKALKLPAPLVPKRLKLGDMSVQVDGVSQGKRSVLVEIYAHQGRMKGSQPHKLMADAIKLSALRLGLGWIPKPRAVLAVSPDVAKQLLSSWRQEALDLHNVEVKPVSLSASDIRILKKTQRKQVR